MEKTATAFIIARLTSSRLPKKQLRHLAGKPIIGHIIDRLNRVKEIGKIFLVTASKNENRELGEFVAGEGIETFYYPDENDVTGRIARACQFYHTDLMVTVSGDCPLIDPSFVSEGLQIVHDRKADYAYVEKSMYPCLHEGIEFFTANTWIKLDVISQSWYHKEHPGSALKENREKFNGIEIIPHPDFRHNDFRMSVDTEADLEFMEAVYKFLYQPKNIVDLHEVVKLIRRVPSLKLLNGHVHQKGLTENGKTVLIVTHASPQIGLGHLSRCMALGKELKESFGFKVVFYIIEDPVAEKILFDRGFQTLKYMNNELKDINNIIEMKRVDAMVADLHPKIFPEVQPVFSSLSIPWMALDYIPDTPPFPSLVILPSLTLSISSPSKVFPVYAGKKYLLLDRKIQYWRQFQNKTSDEILITAGGSVLWEDTIFPALAALSKKFKLKFLIGPYSIKKEFEKSLQLYGINPYRIIQNPPNLFEEYKKSRMAIVTFGVTAYELIALGVPVVFLHVRATSDQKFVDYLVNNKICLNFSKTVYNKHEFVEQTVQLLKNDQQLIRMEEKGKDFLDGLSAYRSAQKIDEFLLSKNK